MPTLLVVDDSAIDRRLAGGLLEKHPQWSVLYAINGRDALRQIELHLPDLVLTDMQMPEMNGFELVKQMKEDYPLIPVMLMTAQGSEEIAVQALQAGAASYVSKHLLAQDLQEIVERVLSASDVDRSESRLMHRLSRHQSTFVLENDASLVPSVVNYLQQLVTRMRLSDETECLRIGVALEEALLNAYYHGNLEISSELREQDHSAYYELSRQRCQEQPYSMRRIFIDAVMTPGESTFVIRDEGPGFDPSTLPDATDPANLERPCGRGLLLMRTFMDHVRFNDVGNEVTMIKRHTRRSTPASEPDEA